MQAGRREQRAQRVLMLLEQLWGEDLPPGPDGALTLVIDALAADDDLGAQQGVVVHGDGLTHHVLRRLLDRVPLEDRLRLIPPRLLVHVLEDTAAHLRDDPASRAPSTQAPLRGVWDYTVETESVMWDGVCSQLLGAALVAGGDDADDLTALLQRCVHPADRHLITDGLQEALRTSDAYQARFRVRTSPVVRAGEDPRAGSGAEATRTEHRVDDLAVVRTIRSGAQAAPRSDRSDGSDQGDPAPPAAGGEGYAWRAAWGRVIRVARHSERHIVGYIEALD